MSILLQSSYATIFIVFFMGFTLKASLDKKALFSEVKYPYTMQAKICPDHLFPLATNMLTANSEIFICSQQQLQDVEKYCHQ